MNSNAKEKCPICKVKLNEGVLGKSSEFAPFCSRRCSDVDLNRWLSGNYAIPATDGDSDEMMSFSDET